jgi:hypothetical protein
MADENINIKVTVDTSDAVKNLDGTKSKIEEIGTTGKSSFGKLKDGIVGATGSFGTMAKAFITNPIGIVLIAITALVGYFSKFEVVTKAVATVTGTLSAVFDGLVASIAPLAKFLSGDFSGAINGFKDVGNQMIKQTTAAYNLADAEDALDEAQTASIQTLAKLHAEEEKLLVQAKNKTLSDKERIALLEQSKVKALEALEIEKALVVQAAAVADMRLAATTKGKNEYDALARAAAEAHAKITELKSEADKRSEKSQNLIDKIAEDASEKEEKRREKKKAAEEKAAEEAIQLAEKVEAERVKRFEAALAITKTANQAILDANNAVILNEIKNEEEKALKILEIKKLASDAAIQIKIDELNALPNQTEAELATITTLNEQKAALELQYLSDIKIVEDEAALQKKEDEENAAAETEALRLKDVEDTKKAEEEKKAARLDALQAGLQSASTFIGIISSLDQTADDNRIAAAGNDEKKKEVIRKQAFEKQKKYSIAMALINGALAVVAAAATVPYIPLGIIAQVLAVGTTIAAVAKISSTQYQGGGSPMAQPTNPAALSGGGNMGPTVPQPNGQEFNPNSVGVAGGPGQPEIAPVRVFVLESDITKSQDSVTNVVTKSTWP